MIERMYLSKQPDKQSFPFKLYWLVSTYMLMQNQQAFA